MPGQGHGKDTPRSNVEQWADPPRATGETPKLAQALSGLCHPVWSPVQGWGPGLTPGCRAPPVSTGSPWGRPMKLCLRWLRQERIIPPPINSLNAHN